MSGRDDKTEPGPTASTPPAWRIEVSGRALWLLVLWLGLGLGGIAWLAKNKSDNAHALARAEARTRAAGLELQFREAFAAVDSLGLLVRQSGGALPGFQKLGTELVSAHPVLAFVELEPGGVVSEVAPAPGHERIAGLNVWKNPVQNPSARVALQQRALTAAGPFTLDHGEAGLVARMPIFQRAHDGREYFWGFVAGSARLADVLARARLETLKAEGYDFVLYKPGTGPRTAVRIASQGKFALDDAVTQAVQAQNLEFRLAVRPRDGWVNLGLVSLEIGLLLAGSFALYRVLNLVQDRARTMETQKGASQQAELRLAEEKAEHAQTRRRAKDEAEGYQAKLKQADLKTGELQSQLDKASRAAAESTQTAQAKLERTQEELQQGRQKIQELQARWESATGAERKAVAEAGLRLERDRARMIELQNRLDGATRDAESHAASLKSLQESNRDLKQRLRAAEERAAQLKATRDETMAAQAKGASPAALPTGSEEDPNQQRRGIVPTNARLGSESGPGGSLAPPGGGSLEASPPAQEAAMPVEPPPAKSGKAGRARRDNQMDLFGGSQAAAEPIASRPDKTAPERAEAHGQPAEASSRQPQPKSDLEENRESPPKNKPDRPVRRLPDPLPVNPGQLRRAVNEILPLLTDQDPGARDCFAANRAVFRSAFSDEAYAEFEHSIKTDDFGAALEQLKRTARKHGMAL